MRMMEGPLPGFVHIVDDDPSFRTAIERRLKRTGYEVATYASAQHLLEQLRSGTAVPTEGTRLDPANHLPHRSSRHPDHGAGHQGGCG